MLRIAVHEFAILASMKAVMNQESESIELLDATPLIQMLQPRHLLMRHQAGLASVIVMNMKELAL
jgi:hypothetical protein